MKYTFVGCSITVGEGLTLEKDDVDNYANIVAKNYSAEVCNLSKKGNSNYNIFITAVNEILFNTPDKLIIQWSGLNRVWLYPSPDSELFLSHTIADNFRSRDIFYSKKELQQLSNKWHLLNHDFKLILTLINYCNILEEISKNKTQIIFINGILPWTEEIANLQTIENFDQNLSIYTKELLNFNNRDDAELLKFFIQLNTAILSLNKPLWVNMFNSLRFHSIDHGHDQQHPGPKSHKLYADMIINYIEETNGK